MSSQLDALERRISALEEFVAGSKRDQTKLQKLGAPEVAVSEGALEAAAVEPQTADATATSEAPKPTPPTKKSSS